MTHYVYRFFDEDDRLLYVGQSKCPISRAASHRSDSAWFWRVAHWTIDIHATRAQALEAEHRAIALERPLFNVNGLSAHDYVAAMERVAAEQSSGQAKLRSIPLPQWVGQADHRAESVALIEAVRRNHEAERHLAQVKHVESMLRAAVSAANAVLSPEKPVGARSLLRKLYSHG